MSNIFKVKLMREAIQDMMAFHGVNIVRELKAMAQEMVELNHADGYVFELGTKVLGEWQVEKVISVDELEALAQEFDKIPMDISQERLRRVLSETEKEQEHVTVCK